MAAVEGRILRSLPRRPFKPGVKGVTNRVPQRAFAPLRWICWVREASVWASSRIDARSTDSPPFGKATSMAEEDPSDKGARDDVLRLSVNIVSAYLGRNQVPLSQIPGIINAVFGTLHGIEGKPPEPPRPSQAPAVPIKRSIMPDYIVCLEDGKKLKMLKRYLRTAYNMTPTEYRARWSLPSDYPMVAPNYAKRRSEFAKKIGLGRKLASGRR